MNAAGPAAPAISQAVEAGFVSGEQLPAQESRAAPAIYFRLGLIVTPNHVLETTGAHTAGHTGQGELAKPSATLRQIGRIS